MPSSSDDQRPQRGRHFYGPGPYIERDVDLNLLESLRAGEYALVFAPRGVGKTSLRIRTTKLLEAENIRVATVDLGAIGAEIRADAFCASLLIEAARTLGLDERAKKVWRRSKGPPQMRLRACLREVLLEPEDRPLILFIDELELVRALGPARDDFFAALRAMADARGHDPVWARLSVCLVGAITRDELISDPRRSSFDLPAREHTPRDFNREQLEAFAETLAPLEVDNKALLDALLDWTAGNPALLQWLCGDLLLRELSRGNEATAVEAIVRETFLQRGPELDPLFGDTARRLRRDHRDPYRTRILAAYERVLRGETIDLRGRQLGSEGAQIVGRMKVAGLVAASSGGKLRVRNRIVERVFDRNWVRRALAGRPVSDALDKWEKSGRRPAQLLRGEALRAASEWIQGRPDVTPSERDFVFASERAHSRRLRGIAGIGSAVSLGLGLALGVLSWQAQTDAATNAAADTTTGEPGVVEPTSESQAEPTSPRPAPLAPAPAAPSFVDAAREALGQVAIDSEAQAQVEQMSNDIAVLEQRLAIERAARAELLAPDPSTRAEGLELALSAVSAFLAAGWDLADAPPPLTRGLTANLPSAGDTSSFLAHEGPVEDLALAAKGTHFASVSEAEVRIWERDSGRRIAARTHLGGAIRLVALSPSGTHVAALADEDELVVWDLDAGSAHGPAPVGVPLGPSVAMPLAPIDSLTISDTAEVTLVRRDGSIDTLAPKSSHVSTRVQASALPRDLPFASARVVDATHAADARVGLVSDSHIELWTVAQGQALASTPLTELLVDTPIAELLATPAAAQLLLLGEGLAMVTVWDSARGVLRLLARQDQAIRSLALSATGTVLATGGDEGRAMLWSIESGERLAAFEVHDEVITSLAFTPDGATLLVGDRSGRVRGYPISVAGHSELPLQASALARDGRAASVHFDASTLELRWAGAQTSSSWSLGERDIAEAALSVDGSLVALRGADGSFDLVSGASGLEAEPIVHIDEQVLDIELSASGQLLVVASEARSVRLFGPEGQTIATLSGHEAPVDRVALSPDATRLVSADRSKVVRVWDPGTAALLSTFEIERVPARLAINGDHVLVIDERGGASLWSLLTRESIAELELGLEPILGVALSDDGQWFALGRGRSSQAEQSGRVELWRASTPEAIASFRARAPVTALRFSEGGQLLLAVDGQAQLARWPAEPATWIPEACALLGAGTIIPSVCEAQSPSGNE